MKSSASEVSGLRQYALVLRRGAPIVVFVTLLLGGLAVFLSARQEPLYQDSADVFIDTKNVGSSLADVGQSGVEPQRVLDTQAAVARVPAIIRPTLAKFSPRRDPKDFLENSSVTADTKADLLTFTVTDGNRRNASLLANAYARAYTEYRRKLDTGALQRAQLQVSGQLRRLVASDRTRTSLYADLTARNQELRTRETLLDSIALPGRPAQSAAQIQPHPVRNGILGAIFGLLLGVGLVFVREALNTRVRTDADIEELLGMPLLGRLHEPPKSLRAAHKLVMLAAPDSPETEAFQLLATNIEFTNIDRGAKSFMVTSANPAEGKSTTVANLAVTFARSGKRVILVDLDLRRPVLHRFFGLDSKPGITEVTLGRAWLDKALVRIPLQDAPSEDPDAEEDYPEQMGGSLEVLPAGPLPPNGSEFVRSQALSDVLIRLEGRADIVLVDAPAMLAVSDAINLTPKVDALIVLTKIPTVRRPAVQELRRILDNAPVAKVGFVLTGAGEGDVFTGGYGYGYGYGYGVQDGSREKFARAS